MSIKVKVQHANIKINPSAGPEIARLYMDLQARQARSGINRFGERMGKDEKGRPIDMFETGNLLFRSASYRILESPDGIEVEVEYTAPYASTLDARYKWIGLAVAAQQQFDTDAEKILLDKVEVTDE